MYYVEYFVLVVVVQVEIGWVVVVGMQQYYVFLGNVFQVSKYCFDIQVVVGVDVGVVGNFQVGGGEQGFVDWLGWVVQLDVVVRQVMGDEVVGQV